MPTVNHIEFYDKIWPLSWELKTTKKRVVEVTYKNAKVPFFVKDLGVKAPYKLNTLDMLEITGFRCGA
jgi:hypothetical protein